MIARAGVAVAVLLALIGAAKPSAPPVVTIVATDFAFTVLGGANAAVAAGPVTFRLVNHGKEMHMMGVVWRNRHPPGNASLGSVRRRPSAKAGWKQCIPAIVSLCS